MKYFSTSDWRCWFVNLQVLCLRTSQHTFRCQKRRGTYVLMSNSIAEHILVSNTGGNGKVILLVITSDFALLSLVYSCYWFKQTSEVKSNDSFWCVNVGCESKCNLSRTYYNYGKICSSICRKINAFAYLRCFYIT